MAQEAMIKKVPNPQTLTLTRPSSAKSNVDLEKLSLLLLTEVQIT